MKIVKINQKLVLLYSNGIYNLKIWQNKFTIILDMCNCIYASETSVCNLIACFFGGWVEWGYYEIKENFGVSEFSKKTAL